MYIDGTVFETGPIKTDGREHIHCLLTISKFGGPKPTLASLTNFSPVA